MKTYLTNQIKNLAICGNSGSGKTTLSETMLFEGKLIERRGSIDQKNTVSDFNDIEHNNLISVYSSVLYAEYNDKKINFIDNPGSDDFVGNLISALTVTDVALMLINSQNGVEVGTEIQKRHLEDAKKPVILAINHLDHEKSNFENTLEQLKNRFGKDAVLVQYPVSEGSNFNAIIDLLLFKMLKYPGDTGKVEITDIPASETAKAEELRNQLMEKAAESEDSLMEFFFDKGILTLEEIHKGILSGLIKISIIPIFCISAKKNIGVGRLMEFICEVVPSPDQFPAPVTSQNKEIKCDSKGSPCLFVFKTTLEPHLGEISFFKVMSGEITEGIDLINSNNSTKERLSQLFAVAGKNRVKLQKMVAGDIGASVKLKNTKTNHTLTTGGSFAFPPIALPEPKYRTAIRPLSESDDEKLGEALNRMHQEDPTIQVEYSKELKQILIHGQGEYHLNIMKWHLDNIYKIATEFLPPRIPYRETITKIALADYRHKKQSGGAGQFGEVHLVIEPYHEGAPAPSMYKVAGKEIKVSVRDQEEYDYHGEVNWSIITVSSVVLLMHVLCLPF